MIKDLGHRACFQKGHATPVFLTGCGRSGTNFLVGQLSRLWKIKLYNEMNPEAFQQWRLRDLSEVEKLVQKSCAPVVLFKPLNDTYRMSELLARFTNAKIIFQFRHYNDVVNSIIRGPFGTRKPLIKGWIETDFEEFSLYPPDQSTKTMIKSLYHDELNDESGSAIYWLLQNQFLLDQNLLHNPMVMLVQYESLIKAPQKTFGQVCEFINIRNAKKELKGVKSSSIHKHHKPDIVPEILSECESLWGKLTGSELST